MNKKTQVAKGIIEFSIGKNGVWASPYRYKYQCWTRDFVIAVEDVLLEWDRSDIVKNHLTNLANKQYFDGRIPIMFLDHTLSWLIFKTWNSIRHWRLSFLLKHYFTKGGLGQLSPWTRDSEILFVLGLMKYVLKTGDKKFIEENKKHIDMALYYVENNLMKDNLIFGGDWRDTRPDLDDKFLLTKNCFLYQAYTLLGETKKAELLDTLYGYKLNGVTLPPKSKKETEIMLRTNQFEKWNNLEGFYEFYDPLTGKGYGSVDQLWSAALYLRVVKEVEKIVK